MAPLRSIVGLKGPKPFPNDPNPKKVGTPASPPAMLSNEIGNPEAKGIMAPPLSFPVGPIGPVAPVGPVAPIGPVAPVAPIGPVAPVAPIGPVTHIQKLQTLPTKHKIAPIAP